MKSVASPARRGFTLVELLMVITVIGMLMALNRPHELAVNLQMAVNNGLSREEIGEAILHAAAYCGVPAGVNSIAVARQFFAELETEKPGEQRGRGKK